MWYIGYISIDLLVLFFKTASERQWPHSMMARLPAGSELLGQVALARVLTIWRPKFCNHKMGLRQLTLQGCGGIS